MASSIRFTRRFFILTLLAAAVACWAGSALGAFYDWLPTDRGVYYWSNPSSWVPGPGPPFPTTIDDVANVSNTYLVGEGANAGPQAILLEAPFTIGTLNISTSVPGLNFTTMLSSIGGSLTFDVSSGNARVNKNKAVDDVVGVPILLNDNLDIANSSATAGGTLTISGGITAGTTGTGLKTISNMGSGSQGVILDGIIGNGGAGRYVGVSQNSATSTLTLSGANTFTGPFTLAQGVLKVATVNNAGASGVLGKGTAAVTLGKTGGVTGTLQYTGAGSTGTSRNFTLATGGTGAFQVDTAAAVLTLSGVIDGSGALATSGPGTLVLGGSNSYTGSTKVNGGTLQIGNGSTTGTLGGGAVTNNGILAFNRSDPLAVANDVGGTGSLVMSGTGALTLSGVNTYVGDTLVNSGTVIFSDALALPPGSNVTTSATGVVVFSSGYTGVITSSGPDAAAMGSPNPVPEPGTIALLAAAAMVGVGALLRRKDAGRF